MPLYRTRIIVEAMFYSENENSVPFDAMNALTEEMGNMNSFDAEIDPVFFAQHLPEGWKMDTLVYHNGKGDLTVADALKKLED